MTKEKLKKTVEEIKAHHEKYSAMSPLEKIKYNANLIKEELKAKTVKTACHDNYTHACIDCALQEITNMASALENDQKREIKIP